MIELQQTPDTNIIIANAKGKITGDDYENILIPAIKSVREQYDKIRILFIIGEDYEGYEGAALWDDTKEGLRDFTHYEKIGLVSDKNWVHNSIKFFGFLIPGEVKYFSNDQLADAEAWITA